METSLAMRHIINNFRQAQTFISVQFNQKNRCENKNYLHERLANDPLKAVVSIVKRFGWGLRGWGLALECSRISSLLTTSNRTSQPLTHPQSSHSLLLMLLSLSNDEGDGNKFSKKPTGIDW